MWELDWDDEAVGFDFLTKLKEQLDKTMKE